MSTGTLTFNSTAPSAGAEHTINGKKFGDTIDQAMLLNTNEEWKIINTTANVRGPPGAIMHPFHIHINPFQIVEMFDPYDKRYVFKAADYDRRERIATSIPPTRRPGNRARVTASSPPFVWWDVFGIPGARVDPIPRGTNVIPGYFKIRSRFADYPGHYVLHCHILAHEDRGMMQSDRGGPEHDGPQAPLAVPDARARKARAFSFTIHRRWQRTMAAGVPKTDGLMAGRIRRPAANTE